MNRRARVTNLWHGHCKVETNWDFSAQFENETLPGHVFRARQRSILRPVEHIHGRVYETIWASGEAKLKQYDPMLW